jgi:ureidoglycolate dehydrogenase (NAD+)
MQPAQGETELVFEHELQELAERALMGLGLPAKDAADAAQILVLADLFGIHTHGTARIVAYGERLQTGGINQRPVIGVERVAPAIFRVDGDNGLGTLVGVRALDCALEGARETGLAIALARASNHFGPVSPYLYLAAEAGFAAMIASNATTTIAPWGGREARLGNNPLGFGFPNPGGDPFMLDMAMSMAARAKIRSAAEAGRPIPPDWATDREGKPTSDPNVALQGFLMPMGAHKGYGLALVVDMLAGVLSGAAYLTHVRSWVDQPDEPQNLGHAFLLIDMSRLGPEDLLARRMNDFRSILHTTPAADPDKPVLVPGEIELDQLRRHRRDGIPLKPPLLKRLHELAGTLAKRQP